MYSPPTEEEIDEYWNEVYKAQPDCKGCNHAHSEHWYPENFPTAVICHIAGCTCEEYK